MLVDLLVLVNYLVFVNSLNTVKLLFIKFPCVRIFTSHGIVLVNEFYKCIILHKYIYQHWLLVLIKFSSRIFTSLLVRVKKLQVYFTFFRLSPLCCWNLYDDFRTETDHIFSFFHFFSFSINIETVRKGW